MTTRQARDCRVCDNPRFDTYNVSNPLKIWGTREALF